MTAPGQAGRSSIEGGRPVAEVEAAAARQLTKLVKALTELENLDPLAAVDRCPELDKLATYVLYRVRGAKMIAAIAATDGLDQSKLARQLGVGRPKVAEAIAAARALADADARTDREARTYTDAGMTQGGRAEVAGMVLAELRELAGQLGVTGTARMRKADLVAAINERQNQSTSTTTHAEE